MYKLIALDMDGTLLDSEKKLSQRNKDAIDAARAQGVTVVLVSGRPTEGMLPYLDQLEMTGEQDIVLSYNASVVQKVASRELLRSQILTGVDAKNLATLARDLGVHIHAFTETHGLITPQLNTYTDLEASINGIEVSVMPFESLDDDEPVMKVMMIDEPEVLSAAIEKIHAEVYQEFTVVQSAPYFLEFLNAKSNKGTGVAMLAEMMGIDASQVICMGDAGNDKHMLEYAGVGVAMGNATEEIKAVANYHTATNDESGVAQVIEELVLNN
ncbi:sugar-phosphatase [Vibrio sp. SCSIO 43136]|uniref:sugar-phosphatase n=1 Tax=Vibrio sp. SCSIO 43136 TaxID=2819101 RepID=UPI0020756B35|nr:sugar-phosphatase [Vibrio sp. SCSIO 43136]USD67909.1 sugar-phosphatase [Vibrio sp. SCSIO 43136]